MDRASRKIEHIEHTLKLSSNEPNSFKDIKFVHQSIPNIDVEHVEIHTTVGELPLSSPIFINAMTGGGGERTISINRSLARVAQKYNLAMAVGSQMAAIRDKNERATFEVVRKENPTGIIISNIGSEATVEQAKEAVEMLRADALQIHLNVVQELVMPEGDRTFSGVLERIKDIVDELSIPVIVKEVGFGMSKETATKLANVGVNVIDVGGSGGTNFAKIENLRREFTLDLFNDWGISTAASICEVKQSQPFFSVIGTGGIRTGLDIAKALSLGASAVGVAGLLLKELHDNGEEGLEMTIERLMNELKMVMTALGIRKIDELRKVPLVISGETFHWLKQRGIPTKNYSQRVYPH
ncbi:type 2 isopentenyl-diphosphate Delta-isomerase [Anaerobacillus alkaliphilus]|uniref:Isopentenyl-diphosphate delta-isomerase n=1 Tax=Anaerobacillus alkaliphilus TaxID=1548597 RepID=A0A4Q0VWS7_9BACI|nr:type 2 isopentenyl-diphosphate Delta-isomerase [Anaerobacillus alkaliphilus]RXJ03929.1 type 2 isopentenyl-diphosphate Delta-isomerase [Anaerobacillus alkaliphilus]